jgi:hypothetical protein
MAGAIETPAPEWIVCLGAERAVVDGIVACPRSRPRAVAVTDCLDCRFLSWRDSDRNQPDPCSTGDARRPTKENR